jgi:hypothetical protein
MFVRFRQIADRLHVSVAETHRDARRVQYGHVASLGAITVPPSPADRIAFWTKLHHRLAQLADRLDDAAVGTILTAIHARIPMPTQDNQRAMQLEIATADADFWASLSAHHAATLDEHNALLADLTRRMAEREAAAAEAAARAREATERLAKVKRGEDVADVGRPMTRADLIAVLGWKPSDMRHAERLAAIADQPGEWDDLMAEIQKRHRRTEHSAVRAILTRRRLPTRRGTPPLEERARETTPTGRREERTHKVLSIARTQTGEVALRSTRER